MSDLLGYILFVMVLVLIAQIANAVLTYGMTKQLDGRLTELMRLNRVQAGNEATIAEKDAQTERDTASRKGRDFVDVFQQGVKHGRDPGHDERR